MFCKESRRISPRIWRHASHLQVPGGETAATVGNLKQGEEYQFRVIAKNKAGKGQPSEPSDRVIAKPRHCNFCFQIISFIFEAILIVSFNWTP